MTVTSAESENAQPASVGERAVFPLAVVLLGLLAVNAAYVVQYVCISAAYPYSICRIEGATWSSLVVGLYPDYLQWPYIPTSYPPVFYLLSHCVHTAFPPLGINAGRMVSLAAACGAASVFAGRVYTSQRRVLPSLYVFLAFWVPSIVWYCGMLYRVDMLLIFFIVLAIHFGLFRPMTWRNQSVACLCLVLVFYTKTTTPVPFVVLFGHWAAVEFSRNGHRLPRRAMALAVGTGAVILAILGVLEHVTDGNYVRSVFGLMLQMTRPNRFSSLWSNVTVFGVVFFAVLGLALASIVLLVRQRRVTPALVSLGVGLLLSLVLLAGTLCREGADKNYYLEPYVWMFSVCVAALPELWHKPAARVLFLLAGIGFVLVSFPMAGKCLEERTGGCYDLRMTRYRHYLARDKEVKDAFLARMRGVSGDILAEDAAIAIACGRTPVYSPYIMTRLHALGLWDAASFAEDLRNGRYRYADVQSELRQMDVLESALEECYGKVLVCDTPKHGYGPGPQLRVLYEYVGAGSKECPWKP